MGAPWIIKKPRVQPPVPKPQKEAPAPPVKKPRKKAVKNAK